MIILWACVAASPLVGYAGTALYLGDLPGLYHRARAWLTRRARRMPLLAPHTGHHQAPAPEKRPARAPAPARGRPVQDKPRPVDPPRVGARGEQVRAGAASSALPDAAQAGQAARPPASPPPAPGAQGPAAYPSQPEADATTTPSGGAAALPRTGPACPVAPGPGQRPTWEVLTRDAASRTEGTRVTVGERHFQPRVRETGGMPALVRPGRVRHEAWRDAAVNLP